MEFLQLFRHPTIPGMLGKFHVGAREHCELTKPQTPGSKIMKSFVLNHSDARRPQFPIPPPPKGKKPPPAPGVAPTSNSRPSQQPKQGNLGGKLSRHSEAPPPPPPRKPSSKKSIGGPPQRAAPAPPTGVEKERQTRPPDKPPPKTPVQQAPDPYELEDELDDDPFGSGNAL